MMWLERGGSPKILQAMMAKKCIIGWVGGKETMQGGQGDPDADKESECEGVEWERERSLLYTYFTSASWLLQPTSQLLESYFKTTPGCLGAAQGQKRTFDGRWHSWQKMTFDGRWPLMEDDLWLLQPTTQPLESYFMTTSGLLHH